MFFGAKTDAWFDIWSIEHFMSGAAISSMCVPLANKVFSTNLETLPSVVRVRCYSVLLLLVEYCWEAAEFYFEAGYSGVPRITTWFHGVEFWGNRMLADPLVTLSGGLVALRWSKLVWPARLLSFVFIVTHVFVFPHCMYLQDLIGEFFYNRG